MQPATCVAAEDAESRPVCPSTQKSYKKPNKVREPDGDPRFDTHPAEVSGDGAAGVAAQAPQAAPAHPAAQPTQAAQPVVQPAQQRATRGELLPYFMILSELA